jgi:CPA2 family monovalent cation:H+ antiporter-2
LIVFVVVKRFVPNSHKALRTGVIMSMGGEFGFALLTVLLNARAVDGAIVQALLTAIVLSMMLGPLLVRYNGRIADRLLRRRTVDPSEVALETAATRDLARREHVIICGFGRVGQNLARVLEQRGFEFIALDLDPHRVREARQAGDPVVYGDSAHPEVLESLGLAQASVVVVSFHAPDTALRIIRVVRRMRADVPILVRDEDDSKLDELLAAGATEVIPATFETSLSLVSHALLFLNTPMREVVQLTDEIRHDRYGILRSVFRRPDDHRVSTWVLKERTVWFLEEWMKGEAVATDSVRTVAEARGMTIDERFVEVIGTTLAELLEAGILLGGRDPE